MNDDDELRDYLRHRGDLMREAAFHGDHLVRQPTGPACEVAFLVVGGIIADEAVVRAEVDALVKHEVRVGDGGRIDQRDAGRLLAELVTAAVGGDVGTLRTALAAVGDRPGLRLFLTEALGRLRNRVLETLRGETARTVWTRWPRLAGNTSYQFSRPDTPTTTGATT